jgi:hypothetical protein
VKQGVLLKYAGYVARKSKLLSENFLFDALNFFAGTAKLLCLLLMEVTFERNYNL